MHRNPLFRYFPMVLPILVAALAAATADACPNPTRPRPAVVPQARTHANGVNNSIVGVWQVTYSSGGSVWDMSFDSWHSDGTENDNDMAPPPASAVCEGVWQMIGPRTAKLHHVGWVWDPTGSVLLGTFILDEVNVLGNDGNTYAGTFTFQIYDLDGNLSGPATQGTIAATRITVD